MKINILFEFKTGAWGGANQFLKALRDEFKKRNLYEEDPYKSDIVIANSYHKLNELVTLLSAKPEIVFIHRLGPIFHYHRGFIWKFYDKFIVKFTNKFADGTIFQSKWSLKEAIELGFSEEKRDIIIYNAPDNTIFNDNNKNILNKDEKFQIIATSNSDNWKKGFKYFQFLDKNLDFSKYEMTFVGRSPINFKNIKYIGPKNSGELAKILKSNDIYLSPVQNEACSNAILEALSCGLPVLALDNSSNSEIVGLAGELFSKEEDLLQKIEKICNNYDHYKKQIKILGIKEITSQYIDFIEKIKSKEASKKNRYLLTYYKIYHLIIRNAVLIFEKIIPKK